MLRARRFVRSRVALTALILGGGALTGLLVGGLGEAQDQQSPPVFAGAPSFADVVEQVNPAVVKVVVAMRATPVAATAPWSDFPFEDFFGGFGLPEGWQAVPAPEPRQGEGSGFIVDPAGYIATNYHVVADASEVIVTLASGERLEATVVGTDALTDLALIRIDSGGNLPAIRFGDSDRARIGEWVLAIGNPFGLGGSVTAGIISARGRAISGRYDDYLQIDAAINTGNSGGPIFNAAGEVIGINTAIFSPTGGNVGIGFAIPSNQARQVLDELRENGSVRRGWLGITMAAEEQAGAADGIVVDSVEADGPAAMAGLMGGDVVTRFDGQAVDSNRTLAGLVGSRDAGDEVEIEILRDGERRELTAELGLLDESRLRASAAPPEPRTERFYFRSPEPGRRQERFYRR